MVISEFFFIFQTNPTIDTFLNKCEIFEVYNLSNKSVFLSMSTEVKTEHNL